MLLFHHSISMQQVLLYVMQQNSNFRPLETIKRTDYAQGAILQLRAKALLLVLPPSCSRFFGGRVAKIVICSSRICFFADQPSYTSDHRLVICTSAFASLPHVGSILRSASCAARISAPLGSGPCLSVSSCVCPFPGSRSAHRAFESSCRMPVSPCTARTSSSKLCGSHLRSVASSTGSRMFPTRLVLPPSCVLCPPLPPTSGKTAAVCTRASLNLGLPFVLSSVTFVWCCARLDRLESGSPFVLSSVTFVCAARASIASWNTGEETGS